MLAWLGSQLQDSRLVDARVHLQQRPKSSILVPGCRELSDTTTSTFGDVYMGTHISKFPEAQPSAAPGVILTLGCSIYVRVLCRTESRLHLGPAIMALSCPVHVAPPRGKASRGCLRRPMHFMARD